MEEDVRQIVDCAQGFTSEISKKMKEDDSTA